MYGQFNEVKIINKIYEKYDFPKTCIEFGAYDGITNANTFYFWKNKGFKSLLIEADPNLFKLLETEIACKANSKLANINCEKSILMIASNGRQYFKN